MITNQDYVHLHNHGDTSFLDGRARHEEIVEHVVAQGHEAVSLTDHDEVNGHINMFNLCRKAGVKFIPGAEQRWLFTNTAASREAKTSGHDDSHIILLAENEIGLRNLWTLSSLAYEPENFYGKPQLNPELMKQYASGLWASDGCGLTRFADYVSKDQLDKARQEWAVLLEVFGDHFYSELHTFQFIKPPDRALNPHEHAINVKINKMNHVKVQFAREMGVPLVVVNDAHYAPEEHWRQHRLVWKMNTKNKKDQAEGDAHAADWMMTVDEVVYWMGYDEERSHGHAIDRSVIEEAIRNTRWIADQCEVEIKPTLSLPRLYDTDADDAKAFRAACEKGLQRFILDKGLPEDAYRARLDREMRLIVDQNMAGYFNVVADYVMRARDGSYLKWVDPTIKKPKPCLCGPGRGSGGGSLVNYVLGITSLDPVHYDLSFERFINPDRPDYPDVDVDFQKSKRPDLISYMGKRYGEDKIVAIGTKSRSGPARTLQDLCIAMKIDFSDSIKMSKMIRKVDFSDDHDYEAEPDYEPPTWAEVIEQIGGDLQPFVEKYPDLFAMVQKLAEPAGLCRQPGVHAAGIVMNDKPFIGLVPTRRKGGSPHAPIATQFDMNEVAWLGGIKNDFLSNKGLDVLVMARDMIWERHGKWIDYDGFGFGVPQECSPENLIVMGEEHYNDSAIWDQIDKGHTAGIFQINTPSGTKQAMKFRPRSLEELADLVSVNRPGVLRVPGLLKKYLKRRHGEEDVIYDHPLMEPITSRTQGILVYQEDLIRTARDLAGFSAGDAEKLRKGIGKKIASVLAEMKPQFIQGCMDNPDFRRGGNERIATKIWASLEAAGAYAFNRAHATGYAMQACWEIWTKHYYFDEFITACLAVYDDKTGTFIRECRRRRRNILPPDANLSGSQFTLTDDGIRYGLTNIKGIGEAYMPDILENRPFVDFQDYLDRTNGNQGGRKSVVESLVKIGAFDWTGQPRQDMLEQYYRYRRARKAPVKWAKMSEDARIADMAEQRSKKPEDHEYFNFDDPEVVRKIEEDLVGTFITSDPMAPYAKMIDAECIRHPSDMEDIETGEIFAIGGQVTRLSTHMQRNHQQMCFITVRWNEEDFEFLAFADSWKQCKPLLNVGDPVACEVIKLDGDSANLSTVVRLDRM